MKINWSPFDPEPGASRAWELAARDKIKGDFAGAAGQHFVEVEFFEEECFLECDARFHLLDRCIEAELIHPLDCEEREPGDGMGGCNIQFEWDEYGFEEEVFKDEITESGIYPIRLVVEEYGGYWDHREVDCWLSLEYEHAEPMDVEREFALELR